MLKRVSVGLTVVAALSGTATGGQLEDGVAAFQRGDYDTAAQLLRPLAKLGNSFAEAILLRLGDYTITLNFAEQGDAIAQFHLGQLLYRGEGVARDYVKAHAWLNLAAARGNAKAVKERDAVARLMTPDQIRQAQQLARLWRPVR